MKSTSAPLTEGRTDRRIYQGILQPRGFPSLPAGWVSEWETFASSDGAVQLFAATHFRSISPGHKALVILHGLNEHGGRYLHFPHYLKTAVDAVYCLDHRGQGRSEGTRSYVERFDLLVDDAILAIQRFDDHLKKLFGKSEIHLLGHSMGGLIALRVLFAKPSLPLHSATISAPLLGLRVQVPYAKKMAAYALSKIWGSIHMNAALDPALLSHDPEVAKTYREDRLVHSKLTPRFFVEMQAAMADTLKQNARVECPIQALIPLADGIVDPDVSMKFFHGLQGSDKRIKTYPGFFHEPFNETEKEKAFEDLHAWIATHSPSSPANSSG